MNKRIFVEKKPQFRIEANSLMKELMENLSLNIKSFRYINVYDLFGFTSELLEKCRYTVFGEIVTDIVTDEISDIDIRTAKIIAIEYLPGQFDQRASSAIDCVHLIDPDAKIDIRSSRLLIFDDEISDANLKTIKQYCINTVESREKDLSILNNSLDVKIKPSVQLNGFCNIQGKALDDFCKKWGLAMNAEDLNEVVKYFTKERRNPTETELRILDTYWSDHCRHTTFTSELEDIMIEPSFMKEEIEDTLHLYYSIRKELGREKESLCLMDLATIGAKYLKKKGILDNLEESEENNACSIYVDVDVEGKKEKWILQFKNETHNHPTEIEPFGGAATCLGGAIRDPLSGRAYVYQGMRVTGAGNIEASISETLSGKLPQKVISKKAAHGFSSYGNQIGLATTHVREIYHPDFIAKRLEVGAVVGAVKAENIRRESPIVGDIILLLGGRTGRDGIGGATGSSKTHKKASLETCGSEVQKGNAPEERKLQHLFRRPEVTRMIKKSNDFGAGGICVAIGELADGLDIYLDRVKIKYLGLTPTELAISESQERMAVVIQEKDKEKFLLYCAEENIEATHVADVTDSGRMKMFYNNEVVVNISRKFIDSAGAKHYAKAIIETIHNDAPFKQNASVMNSLNVRSQKNLIEHFDSTIGRSTVLMPYGGKYQLTPTQVSVQKLPVNEYTDTASVMAYGYDPIISKWSPYHGAAYAVIEACTKVVSCGADWKYMRFSYQEYFERMTDDAHSWGKPLSALLGALKMQIELGLPSIGGKDSMSGSFENINVPPTLIAFGVTTVDANNVISPEFKHRGNKIYLIEHHPLDNFMPNIDELRKNWDYVLQKIQNGTIVSSYALGFGGITEALEKCAAGNKAIIRHIDNIPNTFDLNYGSMIVETKEELSFNNAVFIGEIESIDANIEKDFKITHCKHRKQPLVYLPVFPGTNCDYDTAKAFRVAGAKTMSSVFCNLTGEDVLMSISEMEKNIDRCDILVFSGGFSVGDEPDGSGKFIANVINNHYIATAIKRLLERDGLILGICNGFQALIKSGLLPYGKIGMITPDSPTLFRNDINRHVSQIVSTRVGKTVYSPWLCSFHEGDIHQIAVSHGEGKFVVSANEARQLFENGQVAFQYVSPHNEKPTQEWPWNPNGSCAAIEGIISPDGHILGKMGHSERWEKNLFKNIYGNCMQDIFANAVNWFNK